MIIIVGIPGSGKSSILREVQSELPFLQIVNYGDQMLKEARIADRDLLRKMAFEKQREIGISAAQAIQKEAKGLTIVDTHALVRTEHGFCPGLPKEVLEILAPRICVLVECAPHIILQRRQQDLNRKRDLETEEELALHQDLSRSYLISCCIMSGAQFCRINNSSDSIKGNAASLIQNIRSLIS